MTSKNFTSTEQSKLQTDQLLLIIKALIFDLSSFFVRWVYLQIDITRFLNASGRAKITFHTPNLKASLFLTPDSEPGVTQAESGSRSLGYKRSFLSCLPCLYLPITQTTQHEWRAYLWMFNMQDTSCDHSFYDLSSSLSSSSSLLYLTLLWTGFQRSTSSCISFRFRVSHPLPQGPIIQQLY